MRVETVLPSQIPSEYGELDDVKDAIGYTQLPYLVMTQRAGNLIEI